MPSSAQLEQPATAPPPSQRPPRRWGWLVALIPAVLALALILGGMVDRTLQSSAFDGVLTSYDVDDAREVTDPVQYAQTPPVGGDYAPQWQRCGTYTKPVADERAVASLRRGAVWLTYRPDISEDDLAVIAAFAASPYVLVSPYPEQSAPIIATAWGRQLTIAEPEDYELSEFVRRFQGGSQAPEAAAGCADGLTTTP